MFPNTSGPAGRAKGSRLHDPYSSKDESYYLLLELVSQDPTVQNCFKVIQSTCLAQGIHLKVRGRSPSPAFQAFMDRHYVPFCENALRSMFAVGFVPWRLRRLASGDAAPEVLPLGTYTWSIESRPRSRSVGPGGRGKDIESERYRAYEQELRDTFASHKSFFARDNHPYTIPSDFHKKTTISGDEEKPLVGQRPRVDPNAEYDTAIKGNKTENGGMEDDRANSPKTENGGMEDDRANSPDKGKKRKRNNDALYVRQQQALQRQRFVADDDASKILQYHIELIVSSNCTERDIELYEYVSPTNDITLNSPMYQTVPSPMAHILVDYRNLRQAMLRRNYADAWNTQAKLVVSYQSSKNMYEVNEGQTISNDWDYPQNQIGVATDSNLPADVEQNLLVRDELLERMKDAKTVDHKPIIYTLPKNSKLESFGGLTSIQEIEPMQQRLSKDISQIMGIPWELIGGGYSVKAGEKKALENGRVFVTSMMAICKHLQALLTDVYLASFGGDVDDIQFILRPTPRIEVGTVQELVMLMDAGVVSVDDAHSYSNMLLGIDLHTHTGKTASSGRFSRSYVTPSNEKDMIQAKAAAQAKLKAAAAKPAKKVNK